MDKWEISPQLYFGVTLGMLAGFFMGQLSATPRKQMQLPKAEMQVVTVPGPCSEPPPDYSDDLWRIERELQWQRMEQ